jgi:hypothetical protein
MLFKDLLTGRISLHIALQGTTMTMCGYSPFADITNVLNQSTMDQTEYFSPLSVIGNSSRSPLG